MMAYRPWYLLLSVCLVVAFAVGLLDGVLVMLLLTRVLLLSADQLLVKNSKHNPSRYRQKSLTRPNICEFQNGLYSLLESGIFMGRREAARC